MRAVLRHSACLLVVLFTVLLNAHAQEQSLTLLKSTDSIEIGEQIELTLIYKCKGQTPPEMLWPEVPDVINEHIEVLDKSKVDTSQKEGARTVSFAQKLIVTSFDPGEWAIPPFVLHFGNDSLLSDPLLITVGSPEVDTSQAFKDIKPLMEVQVDWWATLMESEFWKSPWFWSVIAVIVGVVVYFIFFHRKQPERAPPAAEQLPPHVWAYQQLQSIEEAKIWQQGKIKQYYTQVTDVVRQYITARFAFNAMELTSDEIFANLRFVQATSDSTEKLKQLLLLADLVKFAKESPAPQENELVLQYARSFIESTVQDQNKTPQNKDNA